MGRWSLVYDGSRLQVAVAARTRIRGDGREVPELRVAPSRRKDTLHS